MANAVTTIDLLRHGSLEKSGLFCAPPEIKLSEAGFAAMHRNSADENWHRVYTSPFPRCHGFAEQLALTTGATLNIEPDLRELDFGEWIGLSNEQVWQKSQASLEILWTNPLAFQAPGGESMIDFVERVKQQWQRLIEFEKGHKLLLITHAGVIRVILSIVLDIPYQKTLAFQVDYAHRSRIQVFDDGVASLEYHGLSGK